MIQRPWVQTAKWWSSEGFHIQVLDGTPCILLGQDWSPGVGLWGAH